MEKFRIFRQTKSALQSGKKNAKKWLLSAIDDKNARSIDPIMGWVSSSNTKTQLRFEFSSKEAAIAFAQKSGFDFVIEEPCNPSIKTKSYAENFTC